MPDHASSYAVPTHPLAHKPRREWDIDRRIYLRQLCSYCTHTTYVYAPEEETGRYYCQTCTNKNKFPIKEEI